MGKRVKLEGCMVELFPGPSPSLPSSSMYIVLVYDLQGCNLHWYSFGWMDGWMHRTVLYYVYDCPLELSVSSQRHVANAYITLRS